MDMEGWEGGWRGGQKKEARPAGGKQLVWRLLLFVGFSKNKMIPRLPRAAWPARGPAGRREAGPGARRPPWLTAAVSGTWSPWPHTILCPCRSPWDEEEGTVETGGHLESPPGCSQTVQGQVASRWRRLQRGIDAEPAGGEHRAADK